MHMISKIVVSTLLLHVIISTTLPMQEDIFVPENVLKIAQEPKTHITNWFWPDKIEEKLDVFNANLDTFNTNIEIFNRHFANSAFTTENLAAFRKSCAFTCIGVCFALCGIKLLYDSCKNMQKKMDAEQNATSPLSTIFSWRDTVSPVFGALAVGIGYSIISNS